MEKDKKKILLIAGGIVVGTFAWLLYRYFNSRGSSDDLGSVKSKSKGSIAYLEKSDIIRILVTIKQRAHDEMKFIINLYKKQRRERFDNKSEYEALVKKMQA